MANLAPFKMQVTGFKEIDNILKDIPENIQVNAIRGAARQGAKIVRDVARRQLISDIGKGNLGTTKEEDEDRISKALFVKRNIIVQTAKSKRYSGADVRVRWGRDIQVGKRKWTVYGYAHLLVKGNYKKKPRRKKSGQSTGNFRGYGDPIAKARDMVGRRARLYFRRKLIDHVEIAMLRAIQRNTKRLIKKNG